MANRATRRANKANGPLMRVAGASGGVIVAYCHDSRGVDPKFNRSLAMFLIHDAEGPQHVIHNGDVIDLESGPRIPTARNAIVQAFLDHPKRCEWLLFVDTDMVFAPDALDRTLACADPVKAPIVGGLCFAGGSSGVVTPTIRIVTAVEPLTIETLWDYPEDELIQVGATGAAWLLIHRSVLEALEVEYREHPFTWFSDSIYRDKELGEDVTFCLRAGQLGFPVHVHTGIRIGHMKSQVLDQDAYLTYRRGITAHGEEEFKQMNRRRVGMVPGADRLDPNRPQVRAEAVG